VLVLADDLDLSEARNILFRREINQVGSGKTEGDRPREWIVERPRFGPVEIALYTAFPADIVPLTADELAGRAIASVRTVGEEERDGITYLIEALQFGVATPLSQAYERAILRCLEVSTLVEARERALELV
jgi:hypothetical protein